MKPKNDRFTLFGERHSMVETLLIPTPWDTAVLGMPTWELGEYSESALRLATGAAGHYTIKVDPLADKALLAEFGFYYCDTLIEPFCSENKLRNHERPGISVNHQPAPDEVLKICDGAFSHGRFHRDFNLSKAAAALRYLNWTKQLLAEQQVYGLYWQGRLGGFIAYRDNNLVLHAVAPDFRGKGLAKYWWSAACKEMFHSGQKEVKSSISAGNMAVLNLYASLGFSFRNPHDVYHRYVP